MMLAIQAGLGYAPLAVSPSKEQPPNIEDLIQKLRARIDERRKAGEYPPGLEKDLSAHFERIVSHRSLDRPPRLQAEMSSLYNAIGFDPRRVSLNSSIPGGMFLHKLVARIAARQTQGVLDQVFVFAKNTYAAMAALEESNRHMNDDLYRDLIGEIDAILERLAAYERAPQGAGPETRDLSRRVEELEAAEAARQFHPWFDQDRFAEEFRGTRDEILARYESLAKEFKEHPPVLDIGCGRGEFLELLGEMGVPATGVELDLGLAKSGLERGLSVEQGDGIRYLAALDDGSLGGLALIQVVEHMSAQQVVDLVALSAQKLHAGGRVLIETINPQSLYVFAHAFYVDPTHVSLVHPTYLTFLFREAGFSEVRIDWRSPPPADDSLKDEAGDGKSEVAGNVHRLNQLLFAPQDYALIATK